MAKTPSRPASKKSRSPKADPASVPVSASPSEMIRVGGPAVPVLRDGDTTLVVDRPYVMRDRTIHADEIYFVEDAKPKEGPWLGEADKVAWRDAATGYECIMMRSTDGGYLGGYVGVPSLHPLYRFDHEALPQDLGIEVHGGLTYSEVCEDGPTPERQIRREAHRICHAPGGAVRFDPTVHATGYRVQDAHAWWFGFECNHLYDLVPGDDPRVARFMEAEVGTVYRDDAYVVTEILNLAAQLRAVEDGMPMPPREGPPLPPIGLEPDQGG